jgi:hypothetical protein
VIGRLRSGAAGEALRVFLVSRALIELTAVLASRQLNPNASGNVAINDVPAFTHPFGGSPGGHLFDSILSPLARWDSVWFLQIAHNGYAGGGPLAPARRAAFFPLYPMAVRAFGGFGGSPSADLVAAYVVSLAAFLGALYLLYRLVALELGQATARTTILLLAFSPWSVFFGAPYSESLYLLVSVGAFYAARTGRWAWAGGLGAAAAATRPTGIVLLLPLALLYLYDPGRRAPRVDTGVLARLRPTRPVRGSAAFLLLVPLGLALFSLYLWDALGDPWAWVNAQHTAGFDRSFTGPLDGIWTGAKAAWHGLRDVFDGHSASQALELDTVPFVVLLLAGAATAGLLRRLHPAYGVYLAVGLLPALSAPSARVPLLSIPRFTTVLFPLFVWIAMLCRERWRTEVIAASAILAGLFTAQFATWQFVA